MENAPKIITKSEQQEELVPTFALSIEEVKKRYAELQDFIQSQLVKGEDFGEIPGCPKPSLFKPGAEKLATLYGFSPRFEMVESIKNWEQGFFHYQIKSTLISKRTGFIVAEGLGSCNSKEKRYRNQDAYTLDNTILKMAKKRALVDVVLTATRTSGIFTQDVEDLGVIETSEEATPIPTEDNAPEVTPKEEREVTELASDKQQKCVYAIMKSQGHTDEEIKEVLQTKFGISTTRALTKKQASLLIDSLQNKK